jgi:hypothetical protein
VLAATHKSHIAAPEKPSTKNAIAFPILSPYDAPDALQGACHSETARRAPRARPRPVRGPVFGTGDAKRGYLHMCCALPIECCAQGRPVAALCGGGPVGATAAREMPPLEQASCASPSAQAPRGLPPLEQASCRRTRARSPGALRALEHACVMQPTGNGLRARVAANYGCGS